MREVTVDFHVVNPLGAQSVAPPASLVTSKRVWLDDDDPAAQISGQTSEYTAHMLRNFFARVEPSKTSSIPQLLKGFTTVKMRSIFLEKYGEAPDVPKRAVKPGSDNGRSCPAESLDMTLSSIYGNAGGTSDSGFNATKTKWNQQLMMFDDLTPEQIAFQKNQAFEKVGNTPLA
jgi:hypothetical protein